MVLVLVIFYAIFNGANRGTVYGVMCGLLEDLYMGRFIGINAISKGVTAYVIGRLQGNVFKENLMIGGNSSHSWYLAQLCLIIHSFANQFRSI